MSTFTANRIGVMLPRDLPAGAVIPFARKAEAVGFDELWVVEDLGYRGGIAQAATVLTATSTITVGLGILPAAARNVAFTAMEIATLEQLHPGRLTVGIGHGMPAWMRTLGIWPDRPLAFLTEYVTTLTALLQGRSSVPGTYVDTGALTLDERPDRLPPILLGVRGPRSLAAAGDIADGVVLAEPSTPTYIRHAVDLIRTSTAVTPTVVTYDLAAVAGETGTAHEAVRPALAVLALPDWRPHVVGLPFERELLALAVRTGGGRAFTDRLPADWISEFTLSGTSQHVRQKITARHDAGATTVVLIPVGDDPSTALDQLSGVLPRASTTTPVEP